MITPELITYMVIIVAIIAAALMALLVVQIYRGDSQHRHGDK